MMTTTTTTTTTNEPRARHRAKVGFPTLFGCEPGASGQLVVMGVPYDRGTDDIPGAARAPQILRSLTAPEHNRVGEAGPGERGSRALFDLRTGQKMFDGHLLSDIGDLRFRPNKRDDDHLAFIANTAAILAAERKSIFTIGGDHLITLPILRGIAKARSSSDNNNNNNNEQRPFQVVHLDAHFDYGDILPDDQPTHGSFMSYVAQEELAARVIQIGVRGHFAEIPTPIDIIKQCPNSNDLENELGRLLLPDTDVYLTIDTDAFDPLVLPAVSYPVPSGLALTDIHRVLKIIRTAGCRLIGADWTEYNPTFDSQNHVSGRIIVNAIVPVLAQLIADSRSPSSPS